MERISDDVARQLAARTDFVWHQRWPLTDGVATPGTNDIEWLMNRAGVPARLDGLSVLDIGTTNGGAAFLAEQRGASRVVAVDIYPAHWFGFDTIAKAVGSRATFVQSSVYDLPERLDERFDVVFFFGVLYHLRHPLLAVDALHSLTSGRAYVETAICHREDAPGVAEFYPREFAGDGSNWFVPSQQCLREWFESSGFEVTDEVAWEQPNPSRASLVGAPVAPPYLDLSYEVPLRVEATTTQHSTT
jgi:tRNA (mo5U34)-methyltransferase